MTLRHALTNAQWRQIQSLLPNFCAGRPSKLGTRAFLDAVIWRAKTGCAWRDLHPRFGSWKTVYNRFRDWSLREMWPQLVYDLMEGKQWSDSLMDSTYVRAHQHSSGGPGGVKNAIGRSKGGVTTKIHALVDSRGNSRGIALSRENKYDSIYAPLLLSRCRGNSVIADKAYSSQPLRDLIRSFGKKPVIPSRSNEIHPKKLNKKPYSKRIRIEWFFHRLKNAAVWQRGIARPPNPSFQPSQSLVW